jgi:thioredoxin 1
MASEDVKTFTDQNFDAEVLKSPTLTLVDFWATWCAPCKMIAPHVEEMARTYKGRLQVGKVDIDHNQRIAQQFEIRSIPTLLLFRGGKVVGQLVGAVAKAKMEQFIQAKLEQPAN